LLSATIKKSDILIQCVWANDAQAKEKQNPDPEQERGHQEDTKKTDIRKVAAAFNISKESASTL